MAAAELEALAAAYGLVADPRTRFTHLFLNVVPEPHLRQRPPQVPTCSQLDSGQVCRDANLTGIACTAAQGRALCRPQLGLP